MWLIFSSLIDMLLQTMNKIFEHAGDLVNEKVAHNLMRLIAEGFGEDDEIAYSQLRSSAVRICHISVYMHVPVYVLNLLGVKHEFYCFFLLHIYLKIPNKSSATC